MEKKLKRLERGIIFLLIYSLLLTVAIVFISIKFSSINKFKELCIEQADGKKIMVVSGKLPNPILMGKEYPREISPSGITFYNHKGDECGGIGINYQDKNAISLFALDYDICDAIAFYKTEKEGTDKFSAGFIINDKVLNTKNPALAETVPRIILQDENKNACLLIHDKKGNERISVMVDSNDVARIVIKDNAGKVVKTIE